VSVLDAVSDSRHDGLMPIVATINYSRPLDERLRIDVRDFSRTNIQFDPREVRIQQARAIRGAPTWTTRHHRHTGSSSS
jgi:hypothetical protein